VGRGLAVTGSLQAGVQKYKVSSVYLNWIIFIRDCYTRSRGRLTLPGEYTRIEGVSGGLSCLLTWGWPLPRG
jgi:hypothetical protein